MSLLITQSEALLVAASNLEANGSAVAAGFARQGIELEVAAPYGAAAEEILAEIDVRLVDLIVMSTHGRSGLSRLIFGSVAQAVLARSPVPVLLVPPERREQG